MKVLSLVFALTLGIGAAAQAATVLRTYEIAFVQYGLGDDAADWFGKLTVLCDGSVRICDGSVRTFRAVVQGVTYDTQSISFPGLISFFDDPATSVLMPFLNGFAFTDIPVAGIQTTALQFFGLNWALSPCDVGVSCGGGTPQGTYSLTLAAVPLPAALPLAATGLGALVALRRRKRA